MDSRNVPPRKTISGSLVFKLQPPNRPQALWLRWTLLTSENGFRKTAEVWAILFNRTESETQKTALKQSFEISQFLVKPGEAFKSGLRNSLPLRRWARSRAWAKRLVGTSSSSRARNLRSRFPWYQKPCREQGSPKTKRLRCMRTCWQPAPASSTESASSGITRLRCWAISRAPETDTPGSGPTAISFRMSPANQAMSCLTGSPAERASLSSARHRRSAPLFRYRGDVYRFDTVWDALRARSVLSTMGWSFQADRGDLSFRGQIRSEARDFAGVTYEDTDGTFLYCSNTKLAAMDLQIYRAAGWKASYRSPHGAAFEIVSRSKNPYVPLMI